MECVDEHLDKQEMHKLLGEVMHRAGPLSTPLGSPAPDLQVLTKVVLSR